jgi:2-polyprenyl-3-methyl-5-hydroxy-6-metoxy-1,4-benzoquinol methylase
MNQKVGYFFENAWKRLRGQPKRCPSCGGPQSDFVQRKYLVTELRKCRSCRLLFRYPFDTAEENQRFYQEDYSQGFTSDCPSDDELRQLLETGFRNHQKDYSIYLKVLQALGIMPGARLVDFGSSWGYGVWQFQQAGYEVQGFEISRSRARFGREKLGVNIADSFDQISGDADAFFSAHVLEHVPSIQEVIAKAAGCVKPRGLFVAFTPNGSADFRRQNEADFRKLWNKAHPNFLTNEFYERVFAEKPLLLASHPYEFEQIGAWDRRARRSLSLAGNELLGVTVL